jgi:hypothetical protein
MTENCKILQLAIILYSAIKILKNVIYSSLGLYEGRPSYRRSLQPQNKTSSTSNKIVLHIFYFCGPFLPSWIRIQPTKINADPLGSLSGSTTLPNTVLL